MFELRDATHIPAVAALAPLRPPGPELGRCRPFYVWVLSLAPTPPTTGVPEAGPRAAASGARQGALARPLMMYRKFEHAR